MDRSEYWIRFVCAFIVFGLLSFFSLFEWIGSFGFWGVGLHFFILLGVCHYAAKHGDEVWRSFLSWWPWA